MTSLEDFLFFFLTFKISLSHLYNWPQQLFKMFFHQTIPQLFAKNHHMSTKCDFSIQRTC